MFDELPTLEFAATAVAFALSLRALILLRKSSRLVRGEARIESARARDLVGAAVLASAVVYAVRVDRASVWFLVASAVALLAQLLGFYLRARARKLSTSHDEAGASRSANSAEEDEEEEDDGVDDDEEEDENACPRCGGTAFVELTDTTRYLAGLAALGKVSAEVCRTCGALSGHVEDPTRLRLGDEHGTYSRAAAAAELEAPEKTGLPRDPRGRGEESDA